MRTSPCRDCGSIVGDDLPDRPREAAIEPDRRHAGRHSRAQAQRCPAAQPGRAFPSRPRRRAGTTRRHRRPRPAQPRRCARAPGRSSERGYRAARRGAREAPNWACATRTRAPTRHRVRTRLRSRSALETKPRAISACGAVEFVLGERRIGPRHLDVCCQLGRFLALDRAVDGRERLALLHPARRHRPAPGSQARPRRQRRPAGRGARQERR